LNSSPTFNRPEKEWLTVEQLSHILDLKQNSIYQLIYQKKIPSYKRGGRLYFDTVEIDEWVCSGKKKTLEQIKKEANLEIKR
jgi:excisionase family DNA binding protein